MDCPICRTPTDRKHGDSPYWACAYCGVFFQNPLPPKTFHGPDEPPFTDADKAANRQLADFLFDKAMRWKAGSTLDVGCKVPFLAKCLADKGCDAFALDAETPTVTTGVTVLVGDFETEPITHRNAPPFALITLVHTYEHLHDPLAAMRKLRSLVTDDGAVFIRMPDRSVTGWERDLTPHHYTIHPYYHCLADICEMLVQLRDAFVIDYQEALLPGQRDMILRPVTC